jgi:thioredoxin reductase
VADCNITIIGAGPYGLSAAAYLKSADVETRVFGDPMAFWEKRMPAGMFLRSNWGASHIADPNRSLTLDAYRLSRGNHLCAPIPLERFVDYGRWYQRQAVPNVENRDVTRVETDARGFKVVLADGEVFTSRRVIVATGIGSFSRRPAEFDAVPQELASHSTEYTDLGRFKGRRVAVIWGPFHRFCILRET